MLSRLRFALFLPLAALVACATSAPPVTGTNYTPVSGDYVLTVASGTASASYFTGALTVSGSSVSGVFRYTNPGGVCVSGAQDIPFTGSFSNNTLTLTSSAFSNSIATLSIQLPLGENNIGAQVSTGTAVIAGGTCALASTTLQAQLYPSFTGAWTITLTNPNPGTASLSVTQASTPDADGQFLTTGTLVFNSTTTQLTGLVYGPNLQLANANNTVTVNANAYASPVNVSIGSNSGTMTQ